MTDAGAGLELRVEGLGASKLQGLPELDARAGEALLRVTVDAGGGAEGAGGARGTTGASAGLPNVWGTWRVEGQALVFRARHAPAPGVRLLASFSGMAFDRAASTRGTPDLRGEYLVAVPAGAPRVVGVSPASVEIPANLLRLYVEFSAPMSLRGVERFVRLLDGAGNEVPVAFVDVPDGLWDPTRRVLTLFVHPGRVKSGVALGEALGPVLSPGSSVTLQVEAGAPDADGRRTTEVFTRTWLVGESRRGALEPSRWLLGPPRGPDEELTLTLPVLLDVQIAERALRVLGEEGAVEGSWRPRAGAIGLEFRPDRPWTPGSYRLVVAPFLEDVSGNRPGRAFEREVNEGEPDPAAPRLEIASISLPFRFVP